MELTQRYMEYVNSMLDDINLWNNLGFSLYAVLSIVICQVHLSEKYIHAVILLSQCLLYKLVFYGSHLSHNMLL